MAENLPHHTQSPTPMQSAQWEGALPVRLGTILEALDLRFRTYLGQNWIEVPTLPHPFILIDCLKRHERFDMLTDLTAVDYPKDEKRFEVVDTLYSFARNEYVRVKSRVHASGDFPSVVPLFIGANWLEREVFDMFGVRFAGHPDLKRILLPDEWQGHPLLKENSITAMDNDWVQKNLGIDSGQ